MTGDDSVAGSPPRELLEAFAAVGIPERLTGGRGLAWDAGGLVLKPLDASPAMLEWYADALGSVRPERLP